MREPMLISTSEFILPSSMFEPAAKTSKNSSHSIAKVVGFDVEGYPCLQTDAGLKESAESMIPINDSLLNQLVVVVPLTGVEKSMLILGRLYAPGEETGSAIVEENGKTTIRASRELLLRCGEATINMKSTGKITIRGKYVLSLSSGVNAVKGAVVEIN
jgi:hypothetical protein